MPDDRPLALIEGGRRGLVITAVNPAAARRGIPTGLVLADARAAWPGLATRPADRARDGAVLAALARWAGRYGPARNTDGDDGLWIDITGVAHLFGGEAALLADLIGRLAAMGLAARAGLADTLGAAHALARHAASPRSAAVIAAPGAAATALAGLPVAALRLEAAAVILLRRLGLTRIGQLYGLPREALARRFRDAPRKGRREAAERGSALAGAVLDRLDQALGRSGEPRTPLGEPPQRQVRRHFPEPLASSNGLLAAAGALAAELCLLLAAAGEGARRFRLALYRADGTVAEAAAGTSSACRDPAHVLALLGERLAALDAGFGVDVVTLEASQVERLGPLQATLAPAHTPGESAETGRLLDRLANRLGEARVFRLEACASHVPERAERRRPALSAVGPGAAPPARGEESAAARPPFLLPVPERIEVVAEVPEGPPLRFSWRRVGHRVVKAEGPERIAPEWWRAIGRPAAATAGRTRDYYRVEDERGGRFWLFRAGRWGEEEDTGEGPAMPAWFLHGVLG